MAIRKSPKPVPSCHRRGGWLSPSELLVLTTQKTDVIESATYLRHDQIHRQEPASTIYEILPLHSTPAETHLLGETAPQRPGFGHPPSCHFIFSFPPIPAFPLQPNLRFPP